MKNIFYSFNKLTTYENLKKNESFADDEKIFLGFAKRNIKEGESTWVCEECLATGFFVGEPDDMEFHHCKDDSEN